MNHLNKAINNNALWCELVNKANDIPGIFESELWYNSNEVVLFYPNLITLSSNFNETQKNVLLKIIKGHPKNNWAVKDSFASLDLAKYDFFELFESDWFLRQSTQPLLMSKTDLPKIKIINNESDLKQWELAWSAHQPMKSEQSIFSDNLLENDEVAFLAIIENNKITKGLIGNKSDDVIGVSNLFGFDIFENDIMSTFIQTLWDELGKLDLVGYESDEDILQAKQNGFESIGKLKVWMKS
ncbi:MAG: hypothetical protein HRU38_04880 [Saccharospirillaceae bacterium]|nr:hypothetical protein [Pseudomonadales bacterium]NRB77991.1 hypothetical protein [Saccharospirillaceae bacterium]